MNDHWKISDIKARASKPRVVTVTEMEEYITKLDEKIDFNKISHIPLKSSNIEKGTYNSIEFDSKWEAAFYIYFKEIKGYLVERNKDDFIVYISSEGKERKFYYDFLVGGQKYEVKGRFRPDDLEKQRQCPNVIFYSAVEMKSILKEVNKFKPGWKSEYLARL